jgi:hypothetical protein
MERNNKSSYMQKEIDRCENSRGIALGNAVYKILANIISEKIKPHIFKKITRYYHHD